MLREYQRDALWIAQTWFAKNWNAIKLIEQYLLLFENYGADPPCAAAALNPVVRPVNWSWLIVQSHWRSVSAATLKKLPSE